MKVMSSRQSITKNCVTFYASTIACWSNDTTSVLVTLIAYNAVLIAVGLWAKGRTHDVESFYLAGRSLGPWVAAISASASSSSAWTLLGVSGAAYAWGWPALWLFPATVGGFVFNWFYVAPRLRRLSAGEKTITLSEVIAPVAQGRSRQLVLRVAGAIVVFCFVFYIASQFEAAGKAFESVFGLSKANSILIGASIVLVYTLLGGFWAASVTDSVQGMLMVVAAIVLPAVALVAVGGPVALFDGLLNHGAAGSPLPSAGAGWGVAFFFVLGTLGIGIGYPGQPHVVNRFMALKDERSLRQGRVIALSWATLVYAGMLLLGLCARVLYGDIGDSEQVMFRLAADLLPAVAAGIILAAVLSAIMSTADSQLLVAASAVSHDWNLAQGGPATGLRGTRVTVLVVLTLATALALGWRADIFSRVLFAWAALGSAFGPVLLMRLSGRDVSARATLASMLAGFGLTVALSWLPDTPGDAAERVLPFVIAFVIAMRGTSLAAAMKSPLLNFAYGYFVGGAAVIVLYWTFGDPLAAQFLAANWLAVGAGLALITYGNRRRRESEYARLLFLLGAAWLVLLFVAGLVLIWNDGIGVQELQWLLQGGS
jgi:sodium/proline symporter